VRGPQRHLTPPSADGRIVVMPVQVLPRAGLAQFLEWVLVQEDARPLKRGPLSPLVTHAGATGLWLDVAELGETDEAVAWRSYAAFELPEGRVALLVLTAAPAAFPALREVFGGVALSLTG
jgi:hypothetical protein